MALPTTSSLRRGKPTGGSRVGAARVGVRPRPQLQSTHLGQQVPQLSPALQVPQPRGVRAGHVHNQVVSQRAQRPDPSHVVSCSVGRALVLAQVDSKGHPRWNTATAEPGQQGRPPPKGPQRPTGDAPGLVKIATGIRSCRVSRPWRAWRCPMAQSASETALPGPCRLRPGTSCPEQRTGKMAGERCLATAPGCSCCPSASRSGQCSLAMPGHWRYTPCLADSHPGDPQTPLQTPGAKA